MLVCALACRSVAPSPSLSPTPLNSEVLSVQYHVLMPVMFAGSMACHPDLMTTLLNATNGVLPSLRKEVMDFLNVQSVQVRPARAAAADLRQTRA